MKLDTPIGNPQIAPLLVRIALGFYLLYAGKAKLRPAQGLVDSDFIGLVRSLKIMPDQIANVFAILLPYLEIVTGILLIVGLWMTLTAVLSSIVVAAYIWMFGLYTGAGKIVYAKEIIMLASSLSLLYSGAGAVSLDRFRKGS